MHKIAKAIEQKDAIHSTKPLISPPYTTNAPTVAGPTVIGIAIGTTAIEWSEPFTFKEESSPLTKLTDVKKRIAPVPILKALIVMPNTEKI